MIDYILNCCSSSFNVFNFFSRPDIVIALAGNKSDLANRRAVEYEEANGYAEENGLLFMETSAKNANNVNEIFLAIARKLPRLVELKNFNYFETSEFEK